MIFVLLVFTLQLLFSWVYLMKRSMREERGKLIKLLIISCYSILVGSLIIPSENRLASIFYTGTIAVCIINLSALYVRNIVIEGRSSGYLILLAVFPFILFVVFLLLYAGYEDQITDSIVHYYLKWMFYQCRNILLVLAVTYEISLFYSRRKQFAYFLASLDGQLAFLFIIVKLLLVCFIVVRALLFGFDKIVEFPAYEAAVLCLVAIYYMRYCKSLPFKMAKYKRKLPSNDQMHTHHVDQRTFRVWNYYLATADKLMMESQLYRSKNFQLRDLAVLLDLEAKELSRMIERGLGLSFDAYVDRQRIRYFVDHCQHIDCTAKGILSLANEAGFSSKYKFYRAFKIQYGVNPKEYLQRMDFSMT